MPVRVTLNDLMVRKGLKARDVAAQVGLSETQFSLFRSGKVKGIRFSIANILRSQNNESASYKLGLFTTLQHYCQPIYCCIGV